MSRLKINFGRRQFILLAIIWAIAMANFSTDRFAANHTAPYIETLIHNLLPMLSMESVHLVHVAIRKLGHLCEYALFALLLFGSWGFGQARWQARWFSYVLLIVIGYAALDEYHQSLTKLRVASWHDCVIDTIGGALALTVLYLIKRARFRAQ